LLLHLLKMLGELLGLRLELSGNRVMQQALALCAEFGWDQFGGYTRG
jgi:hypothetical protein